jgi:hypothetical protein
MSDVAYITNAAATLTFTAGSKTVTVTGTNPILEGVERGDRAVDPSGVELAIDAVAAGTLTLLRNAPTSGTVQFDIAPVSRLRTSLAANAEVTRAVYAKQLAAVEDNRSIPVISLATAPPGSPADGDRHLVIATATGAFAGKEGYIAQYDAANTRWIYIAPIAGMKVTVDGSAVLRIYTGAAWTVSGATAASDIAFTPTGGVAATTVQTAIAEVDSAKASGPASSSDNAIARFDSTSGKAIQNSGVFIDDSSNLLLGYGTSVPIGPTSATHPQAQIHGGSGGVFSSVYRWSADTAGPGFDMVKSRGASIGTRGVVQSGDVLGLMSWRGDDGTNFPGAALIRVVVDGPPGAGDMPGRIEFGTTADGASASTIRGSVNSAGRWLLSGDLTLGFAALSPYAPKIHLGGVTAASGPTLGAVTGLTAVFSNTDSAYGLGFGSTPAGPSFLQVQRVDGTAIAYNLQLQPAGGSVAIGGTAANLGGVGCAVTVNNSNAATFSGSEVASAGTLRGGIYGSSSDFRVVASGSLPLYLVQNSTVQLNIGSGVIAANLPIKLPSYTVGTVPSASTAGAGAHIHVTNETGGAVTAFSDGTNWRRVTDRAVIS